MNWKQFSNLVADVLEGLAIVVGCALAVLGAAWGMQWLLRL
jgi:hypothetical protein